jgi:hypothetical protein
MLGVTVPYWFPKPPDAPVIGSFVRTLDDGTVETGPVVLEELDHVVMTFRSPAGDTRTVDFIVDNFTEREASGALDEYLAERLYPRLREVWSPLFTEVTRTVGHFVLRDGRYVLGV